jgi:DNA invertase Pin-like site-specific DNA recombinase
MKRGPPIILPHGDHRKTCRFCESGAVDANAAVLRLQNSVAKDKRFAGGAMLIGYARVSTDDQNLELQRATLTEAGCTRIYEEKLSGANRNRPELARLLDHLRDGDVVVVHRLDRLARSTRDLLDIAEQLKEAGAGLRSLSEPWADTTSPAGRMVLTVFAGIAEFERALIHERTGAGRATARARGVRFGRPPKLTAEQVVVARRLIDEGTAVRETARILNVHTATLYRALGTMTVSSAPVRLRRARG